MKKYIFALFALTLIVNSNAQQASEAEKSFKTYLGIATGLNHSGIFALNGEQYLSSKFSVTGNLGMGGWGLKAGIGVKYYPSASSSAIGLVVNSASGMSNFPTTVDAEVYGVLMKDIDIEMNLKPMQTVSFYYSKYWKLGNRFRFFLDAGLALALGGKGEQNYELPKGVELTSQYKSAFRLTQPGGLLLGIGFTVGL